MKNLYCSDSFYISEKEYQTNLIDEFDKISKSRGKLSKYLNFQKKALRKSKNNQKSFQKVLKYAVIEYHH